MAKIEEDISEAIEKSIANPIFNTYNAKFPTHRQGIASTMVNIRQSIHQFIESAINIDYVGHGVSGMGIVVTIKEDDPSQSIFQLNPNKMPVSKLFIKMCIIGDVDMKTPREIYIHENPAMFLPITNRKFTKEIKTQKMVFNQSSLESKPLCPDIIFSEMTTLHAIKTQYPKLYESLFANKHNDHYKYNVGIIVMELAEGFDKPYEDDLPMLIPIFMFLMIRLIMETGFIHADYHFDNILVFKNNKFYFCSDSVDVYPMIIDFGRMIKLNESELQQMKSLYEAKQYFKMLLYVKTITVSNPNYNKHGEHGYSWLYCKNNEYKQTNCETYYNKRITQLFKHYEKCNQTHTHMTNGHEYDKYTGGTRKIRKPRKTRKILYKNKHFRKKPKKTTTRQYSKNATPL